MKASVKISNRIEKENWEIFIIVFLWWRNMLGKEAKK